MKKFCLIVSVFFTLLSTAFAGSSEETVKQAIQKINADVEMINFLAEQGKLDESLELLNKLNSYVRNEISWGVVSYDMQMKAKKENPNFKFSLKVQLPDQFTTAYYDKKLSLCKQHMNLTEETKEGLQAMKDLNNMDKLYAYLQMAKKSYDAAKDMMEDYSTGNVPKAIYDVYSHSKELYEGVKQIYETHKDQKNIQAFQESVKMVVERAERSKKKFEYLQWKINLWKKDIAEFKANMRNIQQIKSKVDDKPFTGLTYADNDYNWNYGPFQKDVEELCKDFEVYESTCEQFKKAYEAIKNDARTDWIKIKGNISASDDIDKKDEFLRYHDQRWIEFLAVVKPIFDRMYNKHCGASKEQNTEGKTTANTSESKQGGGNFERTANDRVLNIESLSIEPTYGLFPGKLATVRFVAKWDGQWLDRVQMRILIDDEVVLNEILAFRNNMGDFLSEFTKEIVIPKHLKGMEHNLSLSFSRDPKILNKSIQLRCTPKTIVIFIAKAQNQSEKEEDKEEVAQKKQDAVPDYNGLFAGAKVSKKVTVVEEKKEPEKQTAKTAKSSSKATYGKYWELSLSPDAKAKWMSLGGHLYVKHMINGRSICYQQYFDPEFKYLANETFHDNFVVKHGPYRRFAKDKITQRVYLEMTGYYRMNKSVGPWVFYNPDGSIAKIEYYVDNQKVDDLQYKTKCQQDNTLPPIECYKSYDWLTVKSFDVDEKPEMITIEDFQEYGFNFPDRLGVRKIITGIYPKMVGQPNETVIYYERLYAKNSTLQEIGDWNWDLKKDGNRITTHIIKFGNLEVVRRDYLEDGSPEELLFYIRKDLMGCGNVYSNSKKYQIGPHYKNDDGKITINDKGKITIKYYDGNGNEISKAQYQSIWEANKLLPHPEIYTQRGALTYPKYKDYDFADKPRLNSDLVKFDDGEGIWKGNISGNGEFSVDFFKEHQRAGSISWYDFERKKIKNSFFLKGFYTVSKYWYKNGNMNGFKIEPANGSSYEIKYSEDGKVEKASEEPKDIVLYRKYIPGYEYPEPSSSSMITSIPELEIPEEEITPLFEAYIESIKNPNASNLNEMLSEGIENDNSIPSSKAKKEEDDDDNYQQLQRQEFFTLGAEVQKIIEKADESFNKKYWEDSNSSRVTMNPTNPKQQALDILRTAVQKVKQAKYPENEAALNHLLAMKFTSYSGRVFSYDAKQDFFKEAARLVVRADQLIPGIKHFKTKEDLSDMYCTSAEVWREMTRKALWGNHEYNKMDCDKMVIRQYERAVQTDPNNTKAKQMLEKLKAPKKAVPEKVQQFEKIPDDRWNNAQQEMLRMQAEETFKEVTKKPEENYLEVATMTLKIDAGTVHIKYAGSSEWQKVTDQHIAIYVGDKIKTSDDAEGVSVTFSSDNTFLAIKPDAEVEFFEGQLMIRRGDVYVRVQKRGSQFLVITPTCAVGVRGTEFEVAVNPNKITKTYLYEGVVETRNGNDVAYLVPGQKLEALQGTPKLDPVEFDADDRKEEKWRNVEQQQQQHRQITSNVPKKTYQTSVMQKNTNNNPFSGSSAGQNKGTGQEINPQLKHDPILTRQDAQYIVHDLRICASPDNNFYPVLVSPSIEYGANRLVARCPLDIPNQKTLTVNWYLNNQSNPVSVGNYQVMPGNTSFDASIISYDSPLKPGTYRVEFVIDNQKVGNASVSIKPPEKLSLQAAQQYYMGALQMMDAALQYVGQGDFQRAKQSVNSAMGGLRKAVYNSPSLPDIMSVIKVGEAILAFEKVDQYIRESNLPKAEQWNNIAKSNINWAYERCQDQQFRQTIQQMKTAIEGMESSL